MTPSLLTIIALGMVSNIIADQEKEREEFPRRRERRRATRKLRNTRRVAAYLNRLMYKGQPRSMISWEIITAEIIARESPESMDLLRCVRERVQRDRVLAEYQRNCITYPDVLNMAELGNDDLWKEEVDREWAANDPATNMYIQYLELEYGAYNFGNIKTYKDCMDCSRPLPVWRSCPECMEFFLNNIGEDIFIKCMECPHEKHKRELEQETKCIVCGGEGRAEVRIIPTDFWY